MKISIRTGTSVILSILVASCSEPTILKPGGAQKESALNDKTSLNSDKMAQLRRYSEGGCAVSAPDPSGAVRGFAVQRQDLPFDVPAVQHDAKSGRGNGRAVRMTATRPGGAPVSMNCWVPSTIAVSDLVKKGRSSRNARWSSLFSRLTRARTIPDSALRQPLSEEVKAFAAEMLAPTSAATTTTSSARGAAFDNGCVEVRGDFDWYDEDTGVWVDVSLDFEVCDSGGGDLFQWVIDNGYDDAAHVDVDASAYSIAMLDSVTFTAHVGSSGHLSNVGWTWEPANGGTWDTLTTACVGVAMTCRIQVHGTGTMYYTAQEFGSGVQVPGNVRVVAVAPDDAGTDAGDADLPSGWDSGSPSRSTVMSLFQGDLVSMAADSSADLGWIYTQGCAQCRNAQGDLGPFTEHAVDIPNRYGDCTDFTQTMIKKVLGSAVWPFQKINTVMFDTLSAAELAKHGFLEILPSQIPRFGDVVVRGKTSGPGRGQGHAGIYSGWGAGNPNIPIGTANNGSPATFSTPNKPSPTGHRNFSALPGYSVRWFRPLIS